MSDEVALAEALDVAAAARGALGAAGADPSRVGALLRELAASPQASPRGGGRGADSPRTDSAGPPSQPLGGAAAVAAAEAAGCSADQIRAALELQRAATAAGLPGVELLAVASALSNAASEGITAEQLAAAIADQRRRSARRAAGRPTASSGGGGAREEVEALRLQLEKERASKALYAQRLEAQAAEWMEQVGGRRAGARGCRGRAERTGRGAAGSLGARADPVGCFECVG